MDKNKTIVKREMLLKLDTPTKRGNVYPMDELTRHRVWETNGDGSYYTGTLLEKMNGITWYHECIHPKARIEGRTHRDPVKKMLPIMYGEIGHPDGLETSIRNVSHAVDKVEIDDSKLYGVVTTLNVEKGRSLQRIIERFPDSIVFRPRAVGTVADDGTVKNLLIFSFDAIHSDNDIFE
jgi:hypothetical protein